MIKFGRTRFVILLIAMTTIAMPQWARAGCPEGTTEDPSGAWTENTPNGEIVHHKCVEQTLPTVSPSDFVDQQEIDFLHSQIRVLEKRKHLYEDELRRLSAMRENLAATDDEMRRLALGLLVDCNNDALTIIGDAVAILSGNGIPAAQANQILAALNGAKAGLNAARAATSPAGSEEQAWKAIASAFNVLGTFRTPPSGMSAEQWSAFTRAFNTLPNMVRIQQRIVAAPRDGLAWSDYAAIANELVDAASKFSPGLQMMHTTANSIDSQVVLHLMSNDRDSIDAAFVKSQSARRFYHQRIQDVDEALGFYRERLSRASVH